MGISTARARMQAAQARATACAARARAAPRKRGAPAGTRRAVLPRMHPARPRPTPAPPRASCRSGRSTLLFDDVVSLRALHTTILPLPSATNGRPASPLPPVQGQPKTAEKSAEGTWSTRGCPHSTPAFARLPHLLAPGWHLHTVVFAFWPFWLLYGRFVDYPGCWSPARRRWFSRGRGRRRPPRTRQSIPPQPPLTEPRATVTRTRKRRKSVKLTRRNLHPPSCIGRSRRRMKTLWSLNLKQRRCEMPGTARPACLSRVRRVPSVSCSCPLTSTCRLSSLTRPRLL
jgi:hypothetical protein